MLYQKKNTIAWNSSGLHRTKENSLSRESLPEIQRKWGGGRSHGVHQRKEKGCHFLSVQKKTDLPLCPRRRGNFPEKE